MKVAIIGGGVAGLATALTLRQIGMDVAVYERRNSVHNLGAGVVCWPNATFILSQMELLDELSSVAASVAKMNRFSSGGSELGSLDIATIDAAMGYPSLAVLREDLMRILLERTKREQIPINYNAQAVSIKKQDNKFCVQLAEGSSISSDLVVGSDGRMKSIVRSYVLRDNRPVYQGFKNWIGIFRSNRAMFANREIHDYWGLGARFGIVPVTDQIAYWAGGIGNVVNSRIPDNSNLDRLRKVFAGWPDPIGEIVRQASDSTVKYLSLFDHDPVQTWHRDNVIMIGDAAHASLPTSGQGVGQALEDAWWLAREFAALPNNLNAAMTNFTNRRLEKTTGIIQTGRHLARALFSSDPHACELRDQAARRSDYAKMARGMAAGWSAGLPLGV